MKQHTITLVVVANLAVLVGLVFALPELMISPGQVIDGHHDIATDCFACHTPFLGSSAEKCVACHAVDDIGRVTTTGEPIASDGRLIAFHQQLREDDCIACHSDHRGVQAFRPIGQFSHDLLTAGLGRQCDSCHARPRDSLHQGLQANCADCHGQDAWTPAMFDHDRYFVLDRDHRAACRTCHVNEDYTAYTCYGCHAHSRAGVRAEHLEEGIRDFEDCVACHRSADEDEAEYRMRYRSMSAQPGGADRGGPGYWRHEHEAHDD
jgi:hypothetical protein